jgi:hypothetical protein
VIGDLTLTRLERTVTATPTEIYARPVNGDPLIHNNTREITFLFPSVGAARLSESLTLAVQQTKGVLEVVGAARVDLEELPELLSGIKEANRPPVVQNKDCMTSSAIVLELKFLHKVPEPSVEAHSGKESSGNAAPRQPSDSSN